MSSKWLIRCDQSICGLFESLGALEFPLVYIMYCSVVVIQLNKNIFCSPSRDVRRFKDSRIDIFFSGRLRISGL